MTVDQLELDALGMDRLEPVTLAEVMERAELLDRVDRKYLVSSDVAHQLVGRLAEHHQVLTIAGRHGTTYRTTYFDTHDLRCVRDHIKGRRRRFKARSRLYVEDDLCQLEVKTKSRRGETLKVRQQIPASDYGRVSDIQRMFIDGALEGAGIPFAGRLDPTVEISCARNTVVDFEEEVRITFDTAVECRQGGQTVALDPNFVVVETKGSIRPSDADRLLWRAGHRPRSFSKYTSAGSLLDPTIADNGVRRMLGTQLHRVGVA